MCLVILFLVFWCNFFMFHIVTSSVFQCYVLLLFFSIKMCELNWKGQQLVHLQCSQRIPQKFISYFPCRDTSKYNVKKIDRLAALAYTGFLDFQHLVRKLHFGNLAFSSHSGMARMGLYIKYTTLFWTNFDPLPLSHIVGPPKVRHTSRTPNF